MACLFPYAVKNKGYRYWEKDWINVPCGKCSVCLRNRSNSWQARLIQEEKDSLSSFFVTATYASESLTLTKNGFPTLVKADFQNFIKRLRKLRPKNSRKIRYYAAGEYGTKFSRPHYHAIIFDSTEEEIKKAWELADTPIGDVQVLPCTGASIAYTLKYMHKGGVVPKHKNDDRQKEFSLMSKGLGASYLTPEIISYHKAAPDRFYVTLDGGVKSPLPRYWKEKIYSPEERAAYAKSIAIKSEQEEDQRFKQSKLSRFAYDKAQFEAKKAELINFKNKSKR